MPEWEYRYFSFNNSWDDSAGEKMASMRDGSGTEYFILFSQVGATAKVYCPGKEGDSRSILDSIPSCFDSFKTEAAFALDRVCFQINQADGALAHLQRVGRGRKARYNLIVEGDEGIVTGLRNLTKQEARNLGGNNAWESLPFP